VTIRAFAVGLPARDEADHIVASIEALDRAAAVTPIPVHLAVVADRCGDATDALARAAVERALCLRTGIVLQSDHGRAGAARDMACRAALAPAVASGAPSGVWVATTDADSVVPPRWFELQAIWSNWGADGCAGLVELDPGDPLPAAVRARWGAHVERRGRGFGHPHVHGANLGLRADLWLEAGGFDHLSAGEDHALWRRARALGARLVATDDIVVCTSARLDGRAPGGFSEFLADLVPARSEPDGRDATV